ncbi:hypothetical protein H4R19_001084 [Coemansia spiralis]|nr:hypothetical protein H4R19_001084 [Coemansia spiralis]
MTTASEQTTVQAGSAGEAADASHEAPKHTQATTDTDSAAESTEPDAAHDGGDAAEETAMLPAAGVSTDTPGDQVLEAPCTDEGKAPTAARSRPSTSRRIAADEEADEVAGEDAEEAADKAAGDEEAPVDAGDDESESAIEKPRVQVYGSTVSGNRTYKKQAKELFMMLEACEVDFEFICIAADEQAKRYVRRKALGNMAIPQIYVDGELRGYYDDAFKANELDELYEWLGLDEDPVDC